MELRRVFNFGKVAYYGNRKINMVDLECELRDWNGYPEFTVCADVWNNLHTDIVAGGQMIDELPEQFKHLKHNTLYMAIMDLWQKYHCQNITDINERDKILINYLVDKNKPREEIVAYIKGGKL